MQQLEFQNIWQQAQHTRLYSNPFQAQVSTSNAERDIAVHDSPPWTNTHWGKIRVNNNNNNNNNNNTKYNNKKNKQEGEKRKKERKKWKEKRKKERKEDFFFKRKKEKKKKKRKEKEQEKKPLQNALEKRTKTSQIVNCCVLVLDTGY